MHAASAHLERQRTFASTPSAVAAVRAWVRSSFVTLGAPTPVIDDLVLVASELASNIVQHSPAGAMVVGVDDHADWWELRVSGPSGPGTPPASWAVAGPDERAGRGLGIVRTLIDDVLVDVAGTTVCCRIVRTSPP